MLPFVFPSLQRLEAAPQPLEPPLKPANMLFLDKWDKLMFELCGGEIHKIRFDEKTPSQDKLIG